MLCKVALPLKSQEPHPPPGSVLCKVTSPLDFQEPPLPMSAGKPVGCWGTPSDASTSTLTLWCLCLASLVATPDKVHPFPVGSA